MKSKIMSGHTVTVARGSASVAGRPYDLGSGLIGVAVGDYAANESGEYEISGVQEFDKTSADVYAFGAIVDWDDATNKTVVDGAMASDFELGRCVKAAGNGDTKVLVLVNKLPGPGPSYS
jgi:predicted RecA/RadA family phage recombinase